MTADTAGNEQTTATLIYIYGPPASGKLTVATRLSELTGIPLFHNHLTVNAVRPVFEFGSPPFVEAVWAMRRGVFEAAAKAGISLIYTNNSAWSGPDPRARFEEAAEDRPADHGQPRRPDRVRPAHRASVGPGGAGRPTTPAGRTASSSTWSGCASCWRISTRRRCTRTTSSSTPGARIRKNPPARSWRLSGTRGLGTLGASVGLRF